jgi:hypothetical protein
MMKTKKTCTEKSTDMKPSTLYISCLSLVIFLCSCSLSLTGSLNPLITFDNAQSFDKAVGIWGGDGTEIKIERYASSQVEKQLKLLKGAGTGERPKISSAEQKFLERTYLASFTDKGILHHMVLNFTTINGDVFAQVSPLVAGQEQAFRAAAVDSSAEFLWTIEKDKTFSFLKIQHTGNTLSFTPVNEEYLKQLMTEGRLRLPFENDELFGTRMLTANPGQLQQFFAKYGKDARLFDKSATLVFKAKG